jgi:hypothetical protein
MVCPIIGGAILVDQEDVTLKFSLFLIAIAGQLRGNGCEVHWIGDDLIVVSDSKALLDDWHFEVLASLLKQA